MELSSILPGGGASSYSVRWINQVLEPNSTKLGLSAAAIVAEYFFGIFGILFFAILGLWALDFLAGIIKVYRCPDEEHSWEKAADGFLKLILYVIVAGTCAMASVVVLETVGWDPMDYFLTGAYSVIAYMEIKSIIDNVNKAWPGLGKTLKHILLFNRRGR